MKHTVSKLTALVLCLCLALCLPTAMAEKNESFNIEMVGNSFSIEYCNINVDGARGAVDELA